MTTAELIAIGTELLLGEIQDTNTCFLAYQLRLTGVDLFRATMVGDNVERIASVIRESLSKADIVITTGGLGPTVDDPTRDAVALAFNTHIEYQPDLWDQILERFASRGIAPTENNEKQAYLPRGAFPLLNPVGTAPAFYNFADNHLLVCLPGVPGEMEFIYIHYVIPLIQRLFQTSEIIQTRVLHTSGIGESVIDASIANLEMLSNPTVGLSAHPGQVDIRITAKSNSIVSSNDMLDRVETLIRESLPEAIYGKDDQSLPEVIQLIAETRDFNVKIFLTGFYIDSLESIFPSSLDKIIINLTTQTGIPEEDKYKPNQDPLFFFSINKTATILTLDLSHFWAGRSQEVTRAYSGPIPNFQLWALNHCLDYIWRTIKEI